MASLKRWLDRRRNPWKGIFYDAFRQWRRENGSARLYDYTNLRNDAVVFDFGGFKGEWTDIVLKQQPDATVHVFEPHPGFARLLRHHFAGNARVHVHECALGSIDGTLALSDEGDASSAVADHGKSFESEVISVARFFETHDIPRIDLAKINIEGGEYDLLPALIDTGIINRIHRLQVQFHLFEPKLIDVREAIRTRLEASHDCIWCYPFVWEEWRLKD